MCSGQCVVQCVLSFTHFLEAHQTLRFSMHVLLGAKSTHGADGVSIQTADMHLLRVVGNVLCNVYSLLSVF